jgi:hypothetical protein
VAAGDQVFEREVRRPRVIDLDVDDAFDRLMPRDRHDRDRQRLGERRVEGDDAFDRAIDQQLLVLVDEVVAMAVAGQEVEIARLQQVVLDPAQRQRHIALADVRDEDADRQAALPRERPRQRVRLIAELPGRGDDAVLGPLGDGVGRGRLVEHQRHRGRRQPETFGEKAERDAPLAWAAIGRRIFGPSGHAEPLMMRCQRLQRQ